MCKELVLYLAQEKAVKRWQLANALEIFQAFPDSLALNLVRLGYFDEEDYLKAAQSFYGVEKISEDMLKRIPNRIIRLVPRDIAAQYSVIPVGIKQNQLLLAVRPPAETAVFRILHLFTGYAIKPVVVRHNAFCDAMAKYYSIETPNLEVPERLISKFEKMKPTGRDAAALSSSRKSSKLSSAGSGDSGSIGPRSLYDQGQNFARRQNVANKLDRAISDDALLLEEEVEYAQNAEQVELYKKSERSEGDYRTEEPDIQDKIELIKPQDYADAQSSAKHLSSADTIPPFEVYANKEKVLQTPEQINEKFETIFVVEASKKSEAADEEPITAINEIEIESKTIKRPFETKTGSFDREVDSFVDNALDFGEEQTLDLNEEVKETKSEEVETSPSETSLESFPAEPEIKVVQITLPKASPLVELKKKAEAEINGAAADLKLSDDAKTTIDVRPRQVTETFEKAALRPEPQKEPELERKPSRKAEKKHESNIEERKDIAQPKTPPSIELKTEPQVEAMPEAALDVKNEPKPEPTVEPIIEPRPEPQADAAIASASQAEPAAGHFDSDVLLSELNSTLTEAATRDEIIEACLKFLSAFSGKVVFFSIKGKSASGFKSFGLEGGDDKNKALKIDLSLISLFRSAVETIAPYMGEPFEDDAIAELSKRFGAKPAKVAVIPIHIKEKPIGLFYMDWAAGETTNMSFQFAKDLRKIISAAFQTLILAKKLGV